MRIPSLRGAKLVPEIVLASRTGAVRRFYPVIRKGAEEFPMRQFPTILAAGLKKAWKRPVALLVCVALLVTAADLEMMAADRSHQTAYRVSLADALRPFHLNAAGASAADHPFSTGATGSPQVTGWGLFPLRWSTLTLPFGSEDDGRMNLRQFPHRPTQPLARCALARQSGRMSP